MKQTHLVTLTILLTVITACASSEKILHFEMPVLSGSDQDLLVWPEPPDTPRYAYVGDLIGEQNYRNNATSKTASGLGKVIDMIIGAEDQTEERVSLRRPQSVVVDPLGRILVSDMSREAVFVFDKTRGQLMLWENIGAGQHLQSPVGIAVFEDTVYVADSILSRVFQFSLNGTHIGSIGSANLKRPTGIAINHDKQWLYVADTASDDIKVYALDGTFLRTIGSPGAGKGQFNAPTYLAYNKGKLYVSDTLNARVQILSETGEPLNQIGQRGLYVGNMTRPKGVAVDRDGIIYVVESYYDHLLIYDKDGNFLLPIGGSGRSAGTFFQPAGISVDNNGTVYVADMFNGRVAIFQYLGNGFD